MKTHVIRTKLNQRDDLRYMAGACMPCLEQLKMPKAE